MTDIIGDVVSGIFGNKAAKEQQKAAKTAQGYFTPYTNVGQQSINTLLEKVKAGPGEYQESPYYNFLMEEGTKGLERGAAARGRQLSGAQQKALVGYGQNLASTDYDKWLNNWYKSLTPWGNMAQMGLSAAPGAAQGATGVGEAKAANWMNWGNTANKLLDPMGNIFGSIFGGGGGGGGGQWGGYSPNDQWAAAQPYGFEF